MEKLNGKLRNNRVAKATSALLVAALALSGLASASPAFANTAQNPTVIFDGNTLATATLKDEVVSRLDSNSLALSPAPLSRVISTTRAGYTFGGWSLERGGAVTQEITTSRTSDTFRVIYAVWNTTVKYNANGADSGALTNFKTQDVYRFGQNLALPSAGTMVKAGFEFGGWMTAPYSDTRITSYIAGNTESGNPTLYAAWVRTVSFDANGATGSVPASVIYVNGGPRLKLPSFKDVSLRKPGFNFAGWSTSQNGAVVSNPNGFVPLQAQNTLYATWKAQTTSANADISFRPGKSVLTASQKLRLDEVATSIGRGSEVKIQLAAVRASGSNKSLSRARILEVQKYLQSAGIDATFTRSNSVATSGTASSARNNRVNVQATWTNPSN